MYHRVLFLVNPMAGRQRIKTELIYVVDALTKAGYAPLVLTMQGRENTRKVLQEMDSQFDLVMCCGGDGTFNEIMAAVMDWKVKPELGYIPAGSTNDFATGIHLSPDIRTATDDIIKGTPHSFDAGKFNDTYFTYVASFGAFTETSYSTPQNIKNTLGHFAYILEGIRELPSISVLDYHIHIETKEKVIDDSFAFGAISNAKSVGGVFKMSDDFVDLNDGLFEVMLIRRPKNPVDVSLLIGALNTMHYDNPMFVTFQTKELSLRSDKPLVWSLDGERTEAGVLTNICCLRDAYRIRVRS